MNHGVQILIPVENQVREFDPKLLLACDPAALQQIPGSYP
jgi:hypothetical protein